jgi:hypothetical protein
MTHQLNREMWNYFLEQIDVQVDGDFLALAAEYEAITGHPFQVGNSPQAMFYMLQQAMMSQDKQLLMSTIDFIAQLPIALQIEFNVYRRHHSRDVDNSSDKKSFHHRTPMASKLRNLLRFNRAA